MIRRLAIRAARYVVRLSRQRLDGDPPAFVFGTEPHTGMYRHAGFEPWRDFYAANGEIVTSEDPRGARRS